NVATGGTKVITGEDQQTMTSQAIATGVEACGASKETASAIGQTADAAIGIAAGAAPAAAKVATKVASKLVSSSKATKSAKATIVRNNYTNGKAAEKAVMESTGGTPKSLKTPYGMRHIDVFENGIAHEVKVGRVSSNERILLQKKDVWLRDHNFVQGLQYDFAVSPVSGLQGPTPTLEQILIQNHIKINYITVP
ncbi:MAG: hypothetical protein K2H98_00880, partial [Duncaniella sp.]|nr:hypothetical protein [Duncaniella sp.]